MKKFFNAEKWKGYAERFAMFWERHGFAVVLLFCAGIIGMTALLAGRYQQAEGEATTTPTPTLRVERPAQAQQVIVSTPLPSAMPETVTLPWPAQGDIQREYHPSNLVWNPTLGEYSTHPAIDIALAEGELILAPLDGEVDSVYDDALYGTTVVLWHPKERLYTGYASLDAFHALAQGDTVRAGEKVGSASDTAMGEVGQGAHLHFFVLDESRKPIDPISLLAPEK